MTTSPPTIADLCLPVPNCNGNVTSSPSRQKYSSKTFCDPVHGQITLPPVCVAIIDTPQFQRLRHIRQTGFLELVYHGSSHNRFGHSLGVCHLANKFLQELKERQPELQISETDILCVMLAGLCHDLGHGPYSHTWEKYMKSSCFKKNVQKLWKHEMVSTNMFDYLIEENNLTSLLQEYGIGKEELNQIKQCILGEQPKDDSKAFLYQIINNDDSGLDVDKFDYFLRDCMHLGLPCSFEYERLMQYAKVFYVNNKAEICFRDKTLESVYNVFRTRSNLHRLAYQHKVLIIIEKMFIDALEIADGKVIGPNGDILYFWEWSMAVAYAHGHELKAALQNFYMLTDDLVYSCLKFCPLDDMKKCSILINAIDSRSCKHSEFYKHIGLKILSKRCSEEEILEGISKFLPSVNEFMLANKSMNCIEVEVSKPVSSSDICVCVVSVDWGKGAQNPVDSVHFYSKDNTYVKRCISQWDVSVMLPKSYEEIQVHVLCRRSDDFAVNVVRQCYEQYWKGLH